MSIVRQTEWDQTAQLEAELLEQLAELKQALVALDALPQRSQYAQLSQTFAAELAQLSDRHQQNKAWRSAQRQMLDASSAEREVRLAQLAELSRRDGRDRRSLKQQRDQVLEPLKAELARADAEMTQLKQCYKALSQQLQTLLCQAYQQHLSHNPTVDLSLTTLYEDDWLIAVDKPAGLLSVPGRSRQTQDSVLSRLRYQRHQLAEEVNSQASRDQLQAVHRLDQDTSGVLLLAKDAESLRHLRRQFEQRQVSKTYEALLQGTLAGGSGSIHLPIAADLENSPRQRVDHHQGKPSQTRFTVINYQSNCSRVRFEPVTGRTHQLRLHAVEGLGYAIVGDRLYGHRLSIADRLCLHASSLRFRHPATGLEISLRSPVPF